MEILSGFHRIDSDLGIRFTCHYPLVGEARTVLMDTGLAGTPEEVIVSHTDRGHCEDNRALWERKSRLRFWCGAPDRPYVENKGVMLAEIYGWSEPCAASTPTRNRRPRSSRIWAATPG